MKIKLLCLLLPLLITACSKNISNKTEKNEPAKLKIAYFSSLESNDVIETIINSFQDNHPGIIIEKEKSNWGGHYEKLRAKLAAGEGPDIYLLDSVFVPQYAKKGLLKDLTLEASNIDEDKYIGIKSLKDISGNLYGIPQGIQVDVLYYNRDMFDEAGLDYPTDEWTLLDLEKAAVKLTNSDHYGFSIPVNHIRYGWYPIIRQFGGDILDKSRRHSTIKSDPYVREAVEYIYRQWNIIKTVPNFKDIDNDFGIKSVSYFPREKVAMYYDAYVGIVRIKDRVNYDVVIQPKQRDRYCSIITNNWVINNNSSNLNKENAWKFLQYYLSDEAQKLHMKESSSLPSNRFMVEEVLKDDSFGPDNKMAFLKSFDFADDLAVSAAWSEQNIVFETSLAKYLRNEISLDEFLDEADSGVQRALDYYYKD